MHYLPQELTEEELDELCGALEPMPGSEAYELNESVANKSKFKPEATVGRK